MGLSSNGTLMAKLGSILNEWQLSESLMGAVSTYFTTLGFFVVNRKWHINS